MNQAGFGDKVRSIVGRLEGAVQVTVIPPEDFNQWRWPPAPPPQSWLLPLVLGPGPEPGHTESVARALTPFMADRQASTSKLYVGWGGIAAGSWVSEGDLVDSFLNRTLAQAVDWDVTLQRFLASEAAGGSHVGVICRRGLVVAILSDQDADTIPALLRELAPMVRYAAAERYSEFQRKGETIGGNAQFLYHDVFAAWAGRDLARIVRFPQRHALDSVIEIVHEGSSAERALGPSVRTEDLGNGRFLLDRR